MRAKVGDDVYGDDPTVNELESKVAALLGKEAALFVPSGTMANQIAIQLHTRPGDTVLVEKDAHCYLYEAGAAPALSGVQFDFVDELLTLPSEKLADFIRPDTMHYSPTRLFVIENTHNRLGGRSLPLAQVNKLTAAAAKLGVPKHCDGARIWNAATTLQVKESDLAAGFDSVAVCFSKGLGAPIGSALCGPKDSIERGRKIRKRWGGGMRQAG